MSTLNLIDKVITTIKKHSMISGKEKILVGLSGGPDSVCLLYALHALQNKFMIDLHSVYIDHGLRPGETPQEIEFCKRLCESLSVPFTVKVIDVKTFADKKRMNKQEAARELRYRVFEETAYEFKAHKVALGHTADDQAETVLIRLIRGSGPSGLAGIPPVRGNIIRPLIETERVEIERFLHEKEVEYSIDSSNLKKQYLRNTVRLSLMPMLKDINPKIIETLTKTTAIFREEERYFEIIIAKTLMKLISRKTDVRIELFLAPCEIMDRVILRRVLRRVIDETRGLRGISLFHIDDIIDLIKNGKAGDRLFLPKGIKIIKEYSLLVLTSEEPVRMDTYTLPVPGEVILKEAGMLLRASLVAKENEDEINTFRPRKPSALFDANNLSLPLTVRPREQGDYFYPLGFGKRKKLQDFFVDEKVPRDERDRIPLVMSGKDILWVVGYRGDDRFKVTEKTEKILKLEFFTVNK